MYVSGIMFFGPGQKKDRGKAASAKRLKPARHVVSTVHGARTVLLDSRSGHYFGLDEVGSRIWSLTQAGLSAAAIGEKLAEEYDAPADQLQQDVVTFLNTLQRARLLEEQ